MVHLGMLCGQNWIAIIAISKMKTLGEKKIGHKCMEITAFDPF